MTVIHLIRTEIEARRLIARARKVNQMAARWRGEIPAQRLCTTAEYLELQALRVLAVIGLAVNLYAAHRLGAF